MNLALKDKDRKVGFSYAIKGIIAVIKTERNFRFHLVFLLLVVTFGFFFKLHAFEWIAVVIVSGMVLASEIVNTTIEKIIDYIKPEYHPVAGFIKDAAAGAVLISAITAATTGLIIFLPKLLTIL